MNTQVGSVEVPREVDCNSIRRTIIILPSPRVIQWHWFSSKRITFAFIIEDRMFRYERELPAGGREEHQRWAAPATQMRSALTLIKPSFVRQWPSSSEDSYCAERLISHVDVLYLHLNNVQPNLYVKSALLPPGVWLWRDESLHQISTKFESSV